MKHPYHSSKRHVADNVEKPGTGIFLMKEHAKLYKAQKNRTVHTLSKRLHQEEEMDGDLMQDGGAEKKKKLADGTAIVITNPPQQMMQSTARPK